MQCYHPKGYQIACNRCGTILTAGGRNVFHSAYAAVETAKGQGWKSLKSKAYDLCPECRKTSRPS